MATNPGLPVGSVAYQRIANVLTGYVSKIMLYAVLTRAMEACKVNADTLHAKDAKAVVEHAMVSLRLFCPEEKLPDLMVALAEVCDELEHGVL